MENRGKRRRGFTLPEVLVTVAIVAVLAAVVVPAVTQQLGKADAPSTQASIGSLRTQFTSFVADVRKFPGQVDHLQSLIATTDIELIANGDTTNVNATKYSAASVAKWKGPYDNTGGVKGIIPIGYGWSTTNKLYDSSGYLVVELTKSGADTTDAHEIEAAIDGSAVGSSATGLIRYATSGSALNPANTIRLFLMSSSR